jgi:hypothetical protein
MNNDELTLAVRESVTGVHTVTPPEQIIRRGRAVRAQRRLPGLAGVAAVVAAAALAVTTLLPAGHQVTAQLTAWTVAKQANGTITVTIRQMRDPAGLQATLRADGLPVAVNAAEKQVSGPGPRWAYVSCQRYPARTEAQEEALLGSVVTMSRGPLQSFVMTIDPSALPSGAGLAIIAHANSKPFSVGVGPLVQASPQCTGG